MNHFFKLMLVLNALVLAPLAPTLAHADVSCIRSPAYAVTVTGSSTINVNNSMANGALLGSFSVNLPFAFVRSDLTTSVPLCGSPL
jgi:hypothetical protein